MVGKASKKININHKKEEIMPLFSIFYQAPCALTIIFQSFHHPSDPHMMSTYAKLKIQKDPQRTQSPSPQIISYATVCMHLNVTIIRPVLMSTITTNMIILIMIIILIPNFERKSLTLISDRHAQTLNTGIYVSSFIRNLSMKPSKWTKEEREKGRE